MRVLLDECIPRPLARHLPGHDVSTVPQMGWASTTNGALLKLAEAQFEAFITVDKGVRYQQNPRSAVLRFIILRARSNRLEGLLPLVPDILSTLDTIKAATSSNSDAVDSALRPICRFGHKLIFVWHKVRIRRP